MKSCPLCKRLYEDNDAGFCPLDGSELESLDVAEIPTDPDDPMVGQSICDGRYQLWRVVADGGMGRVYQGLDTELERGVAVKVLHEDVARDAVAVERFKREYAFSAKLPHEHIVEVLDFERTEDNSYALVMEYLEGEELRHYLQREKTISPAWLIRILSQLAIGLREPHKQKLVHRDMKPDNIFLVHTPDGPRAQLLDFGSVRDNSEGAKKLTVVGTTIGSPFYMSPEQAQGLPELDHRADVWSLAAIAYECLTGQVPFSGKTGPAILLAILGYEPSPPSTLKPTSDDAPPVPEAVDDIMLEGLAKDASVRIASVAELADRFGAAYGLAGDHLEWAYVPAETLASRIAEGPEPGVATAASATEKIIDSSGQTIRREIPVPPPAAGTPPETEADADYFNDADFVMGVPQGPPVGLYVGLGAAVLGFLAAVYFAL